MANDHKHIRWQCRRGMLELDLYFLAFFDAKYASLTPKQQQTFIELLKTQDQTLYHWMLNLQEVSNPEFKELIGLIQDHAKHSNQLTSF